MLWDCVLIVDFLIASIGLTANVAYFRLVVLSRAYDGFCRISAFIISSGMTLIITSNVASVLICLSYGSYFDTGPCAETGAHTAMLYLHAYGEFSITDGIFILVFERYASVFLPTFRSSDVYKLCFAALISLHLMALLTYMYLMVAVRTSFAILLALSTISSICVIAFILVIYLSCAAKEKYYETLGLISLSKRYMLAESYELCKSALPATFVSLAIINLICFTAWPLFLGYLFTDLIYEYFVFMNMTMNLDAALFPILFLYGSKKIRKKLHKISPFRVKLQRSSPCGVRMLNGHRISVSQSQNEYFDKLNHSWA